MSRYEVITRLSNGDKKPRSAGTILTTAQLGGEDESRRLLKLGAIRLVPGDETEADGSPIGTAQRAMAAETQHHELNFVTAAAQLRSDLGQKSHKDLDAIIADEEVGDIESSGSKPTIAEKAEAIVASRYGRIFAGLNRGGLVTLAARAGYADLASLDLAEDAAEDEIRASLMRVAAAKAD